MWLEVSNYLPMDMTRISNLYSANKGCWESKYMGESHDDFFVDLFILSLNKIIGWGYDFFLIHYKWNDGGSSKLQIWLVWLPESWEYMNSF